MGATQLQITSFHAVKESINSRRLHESNDGYYHKLARLYSFKKLYNEAIILNRMAIIIDDRNLEAYEALGDAYLGRDD